MKQTIIAAGMALASLPLCAQKGALVLKTPVGQDYQVVGLSPNGRWACGVYYDANYNTYGFRWDLQSGQIELLSNYNNSSAASVSDNGVVAGTFFDNTLTANGAPISAPGYWQDGSWHSVERIGEYKPGSLGSGQAIGISADGRYLSGALNIDGVYTPMIWKDGKVHRRLSSDSMDGVAYAVSNDGTMATGWYYYKWHYGTRNAALWQEGSDVKYLSDPNHGNPWMSGRKFSADNQLVLFCGGWEAAGDDSVSIAHQTMPAIYEIATGNIRSIAPKTYNPFNYDVYDIANNGTIVGYEQPTDGMEHATIVIDGRTQYLYDYLLEQGMIPADFAVCNYDSAAQLPTLIRTQGITADARCFAVNYYDSIGAIGSMIVALDQNITTRQPAGLKAEVLSGIATVKLSWSAPLTNADAVQGYNLYRNGVLVNTELLPASTFQYYDADLALGTYTYTVKAQYATGLSEAAEAPQVSIEARELSAPMNLTVRQHGVNDVLLQWNAPRTNYISLSYFDPAHAADIAGFGGGDITFEAAIRFSKADMAQYGNSKITAVSFYPMSEQADWYIILYKRSDAGKLTMVARNRVTQQLVYGAENIVKFRNPIDIPADQDLVVAVKVIPQVNQPSYNAIGQYMDGAKMGYSDLIRQESEADFYSLGEVSMSYFNIYQTSWAMDMIVQPAGAETDADDVADFAVSVDGTAVASTKQTSALCQALTSGTHTLGVAARYANGKVSAPTQVTFQMQPAAQYLQPVAAPAVKRVDDASAQIATSWQCPMVADGSFISYASGAPSSVSVLATEAISFAYTAVATYPAKMIQPYEGYQVRALRFYPTADALFTLALCANNQLLTEVEAGDVTLNQWNEVVLPEPITLQAGVYYDLYVGVSDAEDNSQPLAVDCHAAYEGVSDLYSVDGSSFASIGEAGIFGNWMIGLDVIEAEAQPAHIEGYDLVVDGVKVNDQKLTACQATHDLGAVDGAAHSVRVDAYYAGVTAPVAGVAATFSWDDLTHLESTAQALTLQVSQASHYLVLTGVASARMQLFALDGSLIAVAAHTSRLDVHGVPAGMYLLQVTNAEGQNVSVKVSLRSAE